MTTPRDQGEFIVKDVKPGPSPHMCLRPGRWTSRAYNPGSLFCCPTCHRLSILKEEVDADSNAWYLETNRERRKRWKRGEIYKGELR